MKVRGTVKGTHITVTFDMTHVEWAAYRIVSEPSSDSPLRDRHNHEDFHFISKNRTSEILEAVARAKAISDQFRDVEKVEEKGDCGE